jgi:ABC-2 type transport system ATP-binding protein|tara:strand:+ start:686 stop:1561 length:876 start_codon:yes stop_codon:yes gene_type:complete
MNAIELSNLSKFYGNQCGIDSVSFTVKKGEIFGFIGPNGAGKSTTIRTLLGLLKATSGKAEIMGIDISNEGAMIREKIGYLPSEVDYYSEMSSKELLLYHAAMYKVVDVENKIQELATYFQLELDRPIDDLSYGNKKKCAIIQSVLHDPEVLILDEPTGGLDPLMQNRFFELLERQNKKGVTIFFSSHVLSEIQRMCDRAAIIRDGKIMAVEDISTLLSKQMKMVRLVTTSVNNIILPVGALNHHQSGQKITFDYVGPTQDLIIWLSSQSIIDVTLSEPDLERIFMNYYLS